MQVIIPHEDETIVQLIEELSEVDLFASRVTVHCEASVGKPAPEIFNKVPPTNDPRLGDISRTRSARSIVDESVGRRAYPNPETQTDGRAEV